MTTSNDPRGIAEGAVTHEGLAAYYDPDVIDRLTHGTSVDILASYLADHPEAWERYEIGEGAYLWAFLGDDGRGGTGRLNTRARRVLGIEEA